MDGPDGLSHYWHDIRKEKEVFSRREYGGCSIMIWSGFVLNGKTDIAFIDTRINAMQYQQILENHLLKFGPKIACKNWTFQQDNEQIHNATSSKKLFEKKKIQLLEFPPRSPDLNHIENLWGLLARRVYDSGRQFQSVKELKQYIEDCWSKFTVEELRPLISSMTKRVFEVISRNGCCSKY